MWDKLRLRLEVNPHKTAKSLLDELIIEEPEEYSYKLLRTLQRRVAEWRAEKCNEAKKAHEALSSQESATNKYLSLVMAT